MPDPCAPRGIGVLPGRVLSERPTVRCSRSSLRRKLGVNTAAIAAAGLVTESPGAMQSALDQRAWIDPIRDRREVEDQAVVQGRNRHLINIVVGDVHSPVE